MPTVKWKSVGEGVVAEGIKRITQAELERKNAVRETAAESRRLDRVASELNRKYGEGVDKNTQKVRDIVAALKSQRSVSEQVANAALRDLDRQAMAAVVAAQGWDKIGVAGRKVREMIHANRSASERYYDRVRDLRSLLGRGEITIKEYVQALRIARQETVGAANASQTAAKAERERQAAMVRQRNEQPLEAYKRQLREVIRLQKQGALTDRDRRREVARLRRELEAAGRAQKDAFGAGAVSNLKAYLLTTFGVGGAVAAVTSEIQRAQAAANRRAETQLTAAQERRALKLNIASASPEQREMVTTAADGMADTYNVPQQIADRTIRNAISAAPTIERGLEFAEVSLRAVRDLPNTEDFTGGVLDVGNALNSDPEYALGFVLSALRRSRATDIDKFTRNAPRVIATSQSLGIDPRIGTALLNALSVAGADPFQEVSRTGAINAFDRLGKFFTKDRVRLLGGDPEALDTPEEQLRRILRDPQLAKEFVDTVGFRAAGIGGIRGVLQSLNPQARETFNLTLQDLRDPEQVRRAAVEGLEFLDTGRIEATARANRAVGRNSERFAFRRDPLLTEKSVNDLQSDLTTFLRESGVPATERGVWLGRILSAGTEVTASEAADFAEAQLALVQSRTGQPAGGEAADSIRDLIQELRTSAEATRENTAARRGGVGAEIGSE